jgi:exopolysaccharide production protein ExoZ
MHIMDRQNSRFIEVLRGAAVLFVFLHHLAFGMGIKIPFFGVYGGLIGVQLFFVISGYLIAKSVESNSLSRYIVLRVFRIFPVYLLLYMAIGFITRRNTWNEVLQQPFPFLLNLLNLQMLDPVALIDFDALGVSWTLTVEIIWYALAPIVLLLSRYSRILVVLLIISISVIWTLLADAGYLDHLYSSRFLEIRAGLQHGHRELFVNFAFPAQFIHFGWGLAIYWWADFIPKSSGILIGVFGCLMLLLSPYYINVVPLSNVISGFLCACIFLSLKLNSDLKFPPLEFLGKISYSFYLLHFVIILVVARKLQIDVELKLLLISVVSVVLSYVSYRLVERPFVNYVREKVFVTR